MDEKESYLVAIDILCCHLGISVAEACERLGIEYDETIMTNHHIETPKAEEKPQQIVN